MPTPNRPRPSQPARALPVLPVTLQESWLLRQALERVEPVEKEAELRVRT
jgi:hypothetical protein